MADGTRRPKPWDTRGCRTQEGKHLGEEKKGLKTPLNEENVHSPSGSAGLPCRKPPEVKARDDLR